MKTQVLCPLVLVLVISLNVGFVSFPVTERLEAVEQVFSVSPVVFSPVLPATYSNGESVLLIVENTLWAITGVRTAVNQYRLDLNNTGYHTILFTNLITNVSYLKQVIQGYYISDQISGAVLIGNLPVAYFYHPASSGFSAETFICDLFLTDLDGQWIDGPTPDGVYDFHYDSLGDIYPEIYLGRIDASSRSLGGLTNDQNIITLLNRIHSYRTGSVARTHQAITYIDDDWQLWADGTHDNWPSWLQNSYPVRTDVHTPASYTNATDWLNRMTQNYEWAHLCAHSAASPSQHYFGPGGIGEGTVSAAQIHAAQPTFNFYNLFCCHGADWTQPNCLATTYLFSSSYSLAVIGTTKTGGMFGGNYFYNPLAQNKTIGQGFHDWFQFIKIYSNSQYLEWFYGMVIFGDPFLTIHYDCTVFTPEVVSPTHPNQYQWYTDALPHFNWSEPIDVNGISGYYYIIDNNPFTVPTIATGTYISSNSVNVSSAMGEGTWYFHLVAKDGAGNVGSVAAHYQVLIDYNNPTISITSPADSATLPSGQISISWTATDTGSGCNYIELYINGNYLTSAVHPTSSLAVEILENGYYNLTLKVYDMLGYTGTDKIQIRVHDFLGGLGFKIILYGGIGLGALFLISCPIILIARKKKRMK
ncbi:MAG: hypothetical protein JXA54_06450 [Candidatus Heimdallarchaeota archaeon]|nr:hypothetical protein [Candidatus Heimdallarchaeota archaeon]